MSQSNQLELNLAEADLAEISAAVATLINKLSPHLVNLTKEQRMQLPKSGDRSKPFVDKAHEYALQYPEFLPNFVSHEGLKSDLQALNTLNTILRSIEPLADSLSDSRLLAGSEAYQAALIFYKSVKMAADGNIPNADSVYLDLSQRFETSSRATTAEPVEA